VSGSARAEILARVRGAIGDTPAPEILRGYHRTGADGAVERFCERVGEYKATVHRITRAELPATLAELCGRGRIGVPPAAPASPAALDVVVDDPPLSPRALDALDAVLTGCALAIADTGTIVLDGGPRSGRRALTLVPDHHVCIVEAADIVASVPEAISALAGDPRRPLTFVSGPSATSDIELDRVEGVHGPRVLDVIVLG
jgi:L-lactate dehydrogenase complex protein LldG